MGKIKRLAAAGGFAAMLAAAGTAPAMAANPPNQGSTGASVTVVSNITLTLTSGANFSFGSVKVGQSGQSAQGAVAFGVQSDDPTGYTVQESTTDWADGTGSMPASAMAGMDTSNIQGTSGQSGFTESTSPKVIATSHTATTNPATDTFSNQYTLTIPASQAPGPYGTTITDTAVAS